MNQSMLSGGNNYLGTPISPDTDSSWTDDLPICTASGVGFSPNQIYRRDGYRSTEHELEDHSFHYHLDENISLYGVFDGHCGSQAAKFAVQRVPAEILLGQLTENTTEEEIRDVLRQAFLSVEREFFADIIGHRLAERILLMSEIPEGSSPYETLKDYPVMLQQLEAINRDVASGTTAVVVLIFYGKLFVANAGDSRALLCRTDEDGVLRVVQLSIDHDLKNEDEMLRLQNLHLDPSKIKYAARIGNQGNTRCLGNYLVKGAYKENELLVSAISEPVIAEPEIHAGIVLDESTRFLILLSDGLYRALEEASDREQVNIHLAQMIVEEFKTQSTLTGVAQAVVDRVSRMHHDFFINSAATSLTPRVFKRDDMTLLVRNFNFPLPNSISSPTSSDRMRFPNYSSNSSTGNSYSNTPTNGGTAYSTPSPKIILNDNTFDTVTNTGTTSTESSDLLTQSIHRLPLDENGRIEAYVDFQDYYNVLESNPELLQDVLF